MPTGKGVAKCDRAYFCTKLKCAHSKFLACMSSVLFGKRGYFGMTEYRKGCGHIEVLDIPFVILI